MNKYKIIYCVIILAIIVSGIIIFTIYNNNNYEKILTGETIESITQTLIKIENSENYSDDAEIDLANKYLKNYNLSQSTFDSSNIKIERYNNSLDSINETNISNGNITIKLNSDTGEFLSFANSNVNYKKNTLAQEEITNLATIIFNNLNLEDSHSYILNSLEPFDEEVWQAAFIKKYDDLENIFESVKFSFVPETNELVILAINNLKYDNNKIKISEKKAKKIALEFLGDKVDSIDSSNIQIIRPNYYYESSNNGGIHKKINVTRNAYVFTYNKYSKIYIDCTTGEILGGDYTPIDNF